MSSCQHVIMLYSHQLDMSSGHHVIMSLSLFILSSRHRDNLSVLFFSSCQFVDLSVCQFDSMWVFKLFSLRILELASLFCRNILFGVKYNYVRKKMYPRFLYVEKKMTIFSSSDTYQILSPKISRLLSLNFEKKHRKNCEVALIIVSELKKMSFCQVGKSCRKVRMVGKVGRSNRSDRWVR